MAGYKESLKFYFLRIKLIVEHPASHRTNSAGRVKSRKSIGSGRVRTEFEETDAISVYLLAINIHDMGSVRKSMIVFVLNLS